MSSIRLCVPAAETLPAHVRERCGLAALATAEGGPDLSYGAVFLATAPVCASVAVMALLLPAPQEGQDESAAVRR